MYKLAELANIFHELNNDLITFRHTRHRYPELSNQEFTTTEAIKQELHKHDITVLDSSLKTGLIAEIKGKNTGPLIILRADIDGLPISEESESALISLNPGAMHACGHDFHMATILGAAILIKQYADQLDANVRIIFQAAEELGNGALDVVDTALLNDAKVIFGIHNDPSLPVGALGTKAGILTAGVDRFEIKIKGKGTHAAQPQNGNDPIIALSFLISQLQSIVSRNISSKENAVVSVTHITSGSTWNIIPEQAYIEGTVRTFNPSVREFIEKRIATIVQGIGISFDLVAELCWHPGPPSVNNTAKWAEYALDIGTKIGFDAREVEASPIGEDFSYYQQTTPGVFVMIGSGGPHPLHHPKFQVDDRALLPAAYYFFQLVKHAVTA